MFYPLFIPVSLSVMPILQVLVHLSSPNPFAAQKCFSFEPTTHSASHKHTTFCLVIICVYLSLSLGIVFLFLGYACLLGCYSHVWLFVTPWTIALKAPLSMGFSGEGGGGCCALLQGIFPIQGLNLYLLHCKQILYPPGKPLLRAVVLKVRFSEPQHWHPHHWGLLRDENPQTLGVVLNSLRFYKTSMWFWWVFENHLFRASAFCLRHRVNIYLILSEWHVMS